VVFILQFSPRRPSAIWSLLSLDCIIKRSNNWRLFSRPIDTGQTTELSTMIAKATYKICTI